jgi:hypothetical protein
MMHHALCPKQPNFARLLPAEDFPRELRASQPVQSIDFAALVKIVRITPRKLPDRVE